MNDESHILGDGQNARREALEQCQGGVDISTLIDAETDWPDDAPAVARLRSAPITEVVVTDSVPVPPEKRDSKITVLSVSRLFAEAIARIHDGRSVSELYG